MMVYPYRGEDMECAAAARAQMIANSLNNGQEDSMNIYSTSEDDGEFSHSEGGASNSVSTSLLVGTFYNPNQPSDTNSMVSSLQDEFIGNIPPPEHNNSARSSKNGNTNTVHFDHPWKEVQVTPEQALSLTTPRRRIWFWSFLVALSLLIGIAVSMGVIIGMNHEKSKTGNLIGGSQAVAATDENLDENTFSSGDNSSLYDNNEDYEENVVPSPSPTFSQAPRPNSASQLINVFVRTLPSYTQQALDSPTSPQQRALSWLTKDPALTSYSAEQMLQRFVLKTFYFATNGANDELDIDQKWLVSDGWSSSSLSSGNEHECQWFTSYRDDTIEPACDDQGTYINLSVNRNNLRGSLPRELSLLTSLKVLDVELNSIEADIPTELGLLTNLERLLLGSNDFTGSLPSEIGHLSQLMVLELENNVISGPLPSQLGQLEKLVNLTLDDNQFHGNVPTELTLLSSLENLLLHRNGFTGSLPTEIGRWESLKSFSFRNNLLSGSIPTEVGLLTNLERLWGYQNNLGGSIPSEIGQAVLLTQLSLSRNQITGQIPTEMGYLTMLKNLWLYNNILTGSLPSELGLLTELELLPVRSNEIFGAVPEEVCAIEGLEITVDCLEVSCDCDCACANQEEANDDGF